MTRSRALAAAFFLSGASGLAYEVLWARRLSVIVGGTAAATQAVLATFFVGLALGAFLLGPRAGRAVDGRRFYAGLELAIAAAGALSVVTLELFAGPAAHMIDGSEGFRTALVALGLAMVTCLPTTLLMGATFPAVTRALGQADKQATHLLGRAYAANTLGAVAGGLGTAFVFLPFFGVRAAFVAAIVGNLTAVVLALRVRALDTGAAADKPVAPKRLPAPFAFAFLASGFSAIALEIVALRILAVTLEDTVYTFALAVAGYVGGAAATSAVLARRRVSSFSPAAVVALAVAMAGAWIALVRPLGALVGWLRVEDASFVETLGIEGVAAILIAAPAAVPTTLVFIALAGHPSVGGAPAGARRATAWNGIGCALAPLASVLWLMPAGGTWLVASVSLAALALAAAILVPRSGPALPRRPWLLATVTVAFLPLVFLRSGLHSFTVAPGWKLAWAREGASAAVAIEEASDGRRRLRTNNNFLEGGDAGGLSQTRQGLLPALLGPPTRRALVLGIGSGITLGGVAAGTPGAHIDAVELLPEVAEALSFFDRAHGGVGRDPRVSLHVADARAFAAHAAARGERYDLVVGELFHARQAGTGTLYAREHFEAVRRLLAPDGLFAQWIPMHEAPPREVATIVRTFFRVFPSGAAFLGGWNLATPILGLVGTQAPFVADLERIEKRFALSTTVREKAIVARLDRLPEVFSTFVADAHALRRWAGEGPINTDDRPEIELFAPRGGSRSFGHANLLALEPVQRLPESPTLGAADRERALGLQRAWQAFVRGTEAWSRGDLDAAERDLRRAREASAEFDPAPSALRDLVTALRLTGRADRAAALERWLAGS